MERAMRSVILWLFLLLHAPSVLCSTERELGGVNLELDGRDTSKESEDVVWDDAPSVALVCRTHGGGFNIMWNIFFPTYLLFWPIKAWVSSKLVIVLDGESHESRKLGTLVTNLNLPGRVEVKYEMPPPQGTLCSGWRSEGYARQQYSSFYADQYTDAEYVAFVDTDAGFVTPVVPSDLFIDGKPRALGINQKSPYAGKASLRAIGVTEYVGRVMTPFAFPVLLKASHLPQMRADITANMGAESFEEAFKKVCSGGKNSYSQFDMMINYLWHHRRDEYSWHFADPKAGVFEHFFGSNGPKASTEEAINSTNIPLTFVMKHFPLKVYNEVLGPPGFYEALCVGSDNIAGHCAMESEDSMKKVDHIGDELATAFWSVEDHAWADTKEEHLNMVRGAGSAFDWRPYSTEDLIFFDDRRGL